MAAITPVEPIFDEAVLVVASQHGDRTAFGRLYQAYGRMIHGVILAHVPYQDAEDLMHDVFIKALKQLTSLREPAAFSGWLIAIARRTAIDHLRSKKSRPEVRMFLEAASAAESEAMAILDTIKRLPESYRETLIFRLVEGMTGPEIAARSGLTPDSVRVNLCRGMKLLRDQLEGRGKL